MGRQLYTNNADSTLAAGISNSATSLTVATGSGALFAAPTDGDWQMLTLANADGTLVEIVKATARAGDVLTVVRGQEGTTALAWATGGKVQARLTSGMLGRLPYNANSHPSGLALGDTAHKGADTPVFAVSTDVSAGQLLRIGTMVCAVVKSGTTGGTTPNPASASFSDIYTTSVFTTGTAVLTPIAFISSLFASVALGGGSFAAENSSAIGTGAVAATSQAIAVGKQALAAAPNAVAIGTDALARSNGVAIGAGAQALAYNTTAIGYAAKANKADSLAVGKEAHTERAYQLHFIGHQTLGRDDWRAGSGSQYNAGAESLFGSIWVDLGTPQTWAASTVYTEGAVVQPAAPNGFQYRLYHGLYDASAAPNTVLSKAVADSWPTAIEDYAEADANGDSYWIAANLATGVDEVIPDGMVFFPSEIGFICYAYAGVTAAPFVSIGTAANDALLVNNQQLSNITAAQMRHAFTGLKHGITDLRIRLITPAAGAGARFHGRFYAKGMFVHTQG